MIEARNPLRMAIAEPAAGRSVRAFGRSLHSQLADRLGRGIVSEAYAPGELLPNAVEMCERFRVSRTALREAYSVLTAKSLIVAKPKVGTRVRPKAEWNMLDPEVLAWHLQVVPTENFVNDLYVLRQMVEPTAAAMAATSRSHQTIERIARAFTGMERYKDGAGDLIEADLEFHLAILEATGNHFLAALGVLIHASLHCTFQLSWEGAARIQDDRLQQHWAILEAIRDGAPDRASQLMNELLRDSINDVRESLKRRGGSKQGAPAFSSG